MEMTPYSQALKSKGFIFNTYSIFFEDTEIRTFKGDKEEASNLVEALNNAFKIGMDAAMYKQNTDGNKTEIAEWMANPPFTINKNKNNEYGVAYKDKQHIITYDNEQECEDIKFLLNTAYTMGVSEAIVQYSYPEIIQETKSQNKMKA